MLNADLPITQNTESALTLPADALLMQYDQAGPRYTSYPTADRFNEAYSPADYRLALHLREQVPQQHPLSLYVHIPFCEALCYYCACNKIITKEKSRAAHYLGLLKQEIAMHAAALGGRKAQVSQLHLGGGTPTFCSDEELLELWQTLQAHFQFAPDGEYAIEIDPRTVSPQRLKNLREMGFNRVSFGVQDFDPAVQKAVHREQSYASVAELVAQARALGFVSINVDLIYGLPLQSPTSLARTLAQVTTIRPDRIALYAYAHLPQRFKPQRRIADHDIPEAGEKLAMFKLALTQLQAAGYDYIGMDHFALPHDALAVAKRQGRLHRNFQGYSTQPDCDLIAFGLSAIGKIGTHYYQNAKTLDEYQDALEQGDLPIVRGMVLGREDMMRRCLIMAIMCQGEVDFESINLAWLVNFQQDFAPELARLQTLADDGLVQLRADGFALTPTGWLMVRAVAMVFDKHLQADLQRTRYSKII
jgi:oxygen-independent coproporphyrinogen-3 oxidase